jgi:hypothetical protein
MVDVLISQAALGYILKRSPEADNISSQASSKKTIWSWLAKKLSINNSREPKDSVNGENSVKEICHLNDFPMPVLMLENSLDHLISLQHIIHQVVFDLSVYSDQIMSTSYVYEQVYKALYQSEIQVHDGKQISINVRQEIYSEITKMVKEWMKGCNDPKIAVLKIENVIQCLGNLVLVSCYLH